EEELPRGTKIVVHLREEQAEFAEKGRIETILKNYSGFVAFPLTLGEDRINTVEALWRKRKKDITDEEYTEFYKFASNAFDEPRYRMHFQASEPIELNALLFVPEQNTEVFGFGQMEPGVSLYCKNVLIDDKPEGLLPEWLRFLRGVIDSADIPLNISRESMQDSSLVQRIGGVVVKRFLKFLAAEAKDDAEKYDDFYAKFGRFLKEGVVTDFANREKAAELLRFESSMLEKGEMTSFADYLTRAKDGQDKIYYLIGADRETIESGPYLEAFKARGIEVIYFFDAVDEVLVQNLHEFDGKALLAADSAAVELDDDPSAEGEGDPLPDDDANAVCEFLKEIGGENVDKVTIGKRLIGSPVAALTPADGMNAQMRAMMRAMNPDDAPPPVKVELEINPRHELIKAIAENREENTDRAKLVGAQLIDNALLAAGLLEDRKDLISRGFELMQAALGKG
ncbi:MAG: molecular chaperone HtpG, partial [Verrucomicrobiales bacterium]|nr:molecular chaperone HtpG [Verrucomicrobiales bacterium]